MEFHRHSQYILEQFNQQREMGLLCDCTFMVDGVVFKAHKAVLAACSQYFRMLFMEHKEVVDLDISSSEGLGIVLDFMYTGRLNLTSETVDSVLAVAGFLQMQAVTVSCRVFKSPQKTGADSVHTGAQITNRIKSQAKKTNAPMRAGKVLTWEVQPLSAGETPESVGTGTGPAGRLTLRLKQEDGQSTEEPAGMEVELEDSESEETEDEESEIQVEIKDEDEEAIVYVDDVSDVDYTPGNSVNDAVSKSYGVRWQGGTKSCRRDSPAGDDGNQKNRKEVDISSDPTDQVTANRRAHNQRQQWNHSKRSKHWKSGTVAHTCELSLMEQKQSSFISGGCEDPSVNGTVPHTSGQEEKKVSEEVRQKLQS
ncbi:zinc finger and BTB domain-containing protein 17-like isoform X3 [Acipenser ruthenus]|uniref:zinc finger and BTB domain-containing protein 17-like isoform X3 n=1 Tax=Acipenser ruthenus TaxID=7906 RepID=UPI0027418385|nr:zinc finger and BTB domain-containing protein 17-like isoform X3 [Acipenser ruthenus]XP_058858127.1 zinc finger and BTB domain-containing protein 17-like isoform X3 [Acipenser ruthenus]XP_058858128.1 zinc finger and BTB domain-containing protein 17-like isoform X3 [Acipenser ruthenus]XP_058858129.1 zinc finger and BTB domain-containing protein 17-like isoform X3 [Acipenser ruthenus]XP_058858130.1 zinc finger and BTB domain-containing protein 17-like isoform X3 [Acipenser ruthenus]XP_0588581